MCAAVVAGGRQVGDQTCKAASLYIFTRVVTAIVTHWMAFVLENKTCTHRLITQKVLFVFVKILVLTCRIPLVNSPIMLVRVPLIAAHSENFGRVELIGCIYD